MSIFTHLVISLLLFLAVHQLDSSTAYISYTNIQKYWQCHHCEIWADSSIFLDIRKFHFTFSSWWCMWYFRVTQRAIWQVCCSYGTLIYLFLTSWHILLSFALLDFWWKKIPSHPRSSFTFKILFFRTNSKKIRIYCRIIY